MHPILMVLVLTVSLLGNQAGANEIVSGASRAKELDSLFPVPRSNAQNDIEIELNCIQHKANEGHVIKGAQATAMIKRLAKPLEAGFKKFNISPFSRALFYAQAIEESGGFIHLSEAKSFKKEADDPLAHVILSANRDDEFKTAKANAYASHSLGVYRGRGLIQITGCDNYMTVIHYLNQMNRNVVPDRKSYWDFPVGKDPVTQKVKRKQVGMKCNERELQALKDEYERTQKMNPDLYGALTEPMKLAAIGMTLQDRYTKRSIDSEQLLVESSLAYWDLRCAERARNVKSVDVLAAYPACSGFKGDHLDKAAKCITECIKGTSKGWERRRMWLEKAIFCMRY